MKKQKNKKSCEFLDKTTELAYERTFLANERTFIAWLRTAVALVGAGLGVVKFLDTEGPYMLMKVLGILLVITGEISYIGAYWRYKRLRDELCEVDLLVTPMWTLIPLNISVLIMSIVSLIVIFDN